MQSPASPIPGTPRLRLTLAALSLVAMFGAARTDAASHWPQFRGPGGTAVAETDATPPTHFGPGTNVIWKTALPPGHSSPCIWGDKIFLTGLDQGKLETLCVSRTDGRVIWRQAAPVAKVEETHRIGSPAASTAATDGQAVYVYFGSFGLLAYDFDGTEHW